MIELTNVSLRYPQSAEALRDVSMTLPEGSIHFLTGRSGAGKSSLLRLLYLGQRPTTGRLTIFGKDAAALSRREVALIRRRIGVVFQDFQLLDHLSLYQNVALPLVVAGLPERDYRADVVEMLEWVDLAEKMTCLPRQLSGGEKQRAAIARAVVTAPELIIADEPTGSVDPQMGAKIMALFNEMHRLGRTVLIATHDLDLVLRTRAPRLHLDQGRLIPPPERSRPEDVAATASRGRSLDAQNGAARASRDVGAARSAEPTDPASESAFAALSASLSAVRRGSVDPRRGHASFAAEADEQGGEPRLSKRRSEEAAAT